MNYVQPVLVNHTSVQLWQNIKAVRLIQWKAKSPSLVSMEIQETRILLTL